MELPPGTSLGPYTIVGHVGRGRNGAGISWQRHATRSRSEVGRLFVTRISFSKRPPDLKEFSLEVTPLRRDKLQPHFWS
jgi:hypothetical protein